MSLATPLPLSSLFAVADFEEIHDAEDETFDLFSVPIPSSNLGFVDANETDLELEVGNQTFHIRQSSGLLHSNRAGGTTGAVLWKVTPLVAQWLADSANMLWRCRVLHSDATVFELGCGISGMIGLALHQRVRKYVLTDQAYVMKTLGQNIAANIKSERKHGKRSKDSTEQSNLHLSHFDWETDSADNFKDVTGTAISGFDLVIACDCIYNDFLVSPFVQACRDVCQLRDADPTISPTVLLVAQQQRSAEVFESWLREVLRYFRVGRVPDHWLGPGLESGSGYILHLAILRETHR